MATTMAREVAHGLVDKMPENATRWARQVAHTRLKDDLLHEIYVRQAIEKGLADSKAGRTTDVQDIRRQYGLPR